MEYIKQIDLDASAWGTVREFYDAILERLGAPDWHGRSIAALIDSMIYGNINEISPPYTITIRGVGRCARDVRDELSIFFREMRRSKNEYELQKRRAPGICIILEQ